MYLVDMQLGEFNILMDKRNVYDWNTRIHLLAAGPGIKAGSTWVRRLFTSSHYFYFKQVVEEC